MSVTGWLCRRRSAKQMLLACIFFLAAAPLGCEHSTTSSSSPQEELVASPAEAEVDDPLLQEVTQQVGLQFLHQVPAEPVYFMPSSMGSGAALLDYDGDGRLDIYLIQNAGPDSGVTNCLYRQDENGHFVDVSSGSGLQVDGFGMGVAVGDVNNDGRVDLFLSEYGRSRLFWNQTTGSEPRFVEVTESGIDNTMWGTSTCLFDYDRDGWLDIALVNYVSYDPSRWCADESSRQEFCGPDAFPGQITRLFRNESANGAIRFRDVTIPSGLSNHKGPGLGVYCADFDGDRWPDIFVANDGKPNHLWVNQRDGRFAEEAITRGIAYNNMGKSEADMGVAIGDVDGNGLFDLFVTHLSEETHTLWNQGPRGIFVDRTAASGLTASRWRGTGFGTAMVDLDNDGDLDLLLANGRVTRSSGPQPPMHPSVSAFWKAYAERNQILLNDGQGRFTDVSPQCGDFSQLASVSRGLVCGDLNNDGALDILVTRLAGPPSLYQNVGARGHWLLVQAVDPALQRDAYGAEVRVFAGTQRWMRSINPGYSYLCSNDPRAHFGLGDVEKLDRIEVIWPDGSAESFPGGAVDRQIVLERGTGKPLPSATGSDPPE